METPVATNAQELYGAGVTVDIARIDPAEWDSILAPEDLQASLAGDGRPPNASATSRARLYTTVEATTTAIGSRSCA